jgi:hypothetical protein
MAVQVLSPLRETFIVEEQHEQEGPEHTDGVVGRAATRARGIEGAQQGTSRVELEAQEHEGGLVPGLRETTGLAAQPALEFLGERGGILAV